MHAFTVGFGLGFFVALQLGPLSLYLIRSTLRAGLAVGLAIAGGIAVIDLAYAALGAAGAAPLLAIGPLDTVLGLLGAAVLVFLGVRTLWSAFRIRLGTDEGEALSPKRAFLTRSRRRPRTRSRSRRGRRSSRRRARRARQTRREGRRCSSRASGSAAWSGTGSSPWRRHSSGAPRVQAAPHGRPRRRRRPDLLRVRSRV